MKNNPDEIKTEQEIKRRTIFFWLGRALLVFVIFFFSIIILIQLPFVQIWGARQLSKSISKSLNTTVTIGGFNLHPISDLSLKNVLIGSPDYPLDTMIRAKSLNVDFQGLWHLLYNQLTVNQIIIDEGFLNIEKKAGDTLTNLDVAMLRLLPAKDTSKASFVLDLEKISATMLQVRINDQTKGSLIKMLFERADIAIDTLDMEGQYIRADYIDFDRPLINITQKVTEAVIHSSAEKQDVLWSFDIGRFKWTDGKIYVNNENKPVDSTQMYGMNYAHMVLPDVDISGDSLSIRGFNFSGKNIDIHLLHQNGFELKTAAASYASLSENGIVLDDLELETKESHIRNSVAINFSGYDDFKSFADSVRFSIPAANIRLHLNDILVFVPSLAKVRFFADNKDKSLLLEGNVSGHINRLRILDMNAGIGGISMVGNFRSRDLAISGSQLLSLDMDRATVSAAALKDLFPRMQIPPIFKKLGEVRMTGKFDGYPDDFVANGNINTALGNLKLDMNLNFVKGISNAKYSGTISMDNFALGTLIGNKDIGRVTMTGRVIEGRGLSTESLFADITAVMSSAVYKGYTYRNARLDGQISAGQFTGTMDINDPNVDMHFEGTFDYTGKSPTLDFVSRIDSIRFLPLGFGSQPIIVSGYFDVDLETGSLDDFNGTISGENVTLRIKDVSFYLDSFYADALTDPVSGDRFYNIKSDVVSAVLSGVFDPLTLPNQIHQYLHNNYPGAIAPPEKFVAVDKSVRMSWDIRVHDSGLWLDMAGLPGLVIKNAYTHGSLDLNEEHINGFVELPELHYGGINAYGSSINFEENNGTIDGDLEIIAADLKENLFLEDVIVEGTGTDDSLRLRIKTDHIAEIIDELDVELFADPENGFWSFSINPIKLEMLGDAWMIPPGNLIEIRNKEFNLENFELVSGDRRIVVDDINNKGIEAFITGFDVDYLNTLWVTDKFEFSGTYTLDLEVDNIYDIQQLSTVLHVPAMKINNIPYGEWIFNASMNDPKDSVKIDIEMNNKETTLVGKGAYLPPIKSIPQEDQNYLRMTLEATEFPLDFLEFLLGGNIRDTEGSVDLVLNLDGKVNSLNPRGTGKVYNGSTTIDYLGTAYTFHDQSFAITESMIDLSGTKLYDIQGNVAFVDGGITHRHLKDLGLDARISSDKIIALDVTSEENSSFYGYAIGSVDATFSGTIANIDMDIIVNETLEGTHIYIPLSSGITTSDRDFVIFLENGKLPVSKTVPFNLGGINLSMDLNISENAIIEIIFDDNTGEVLQATGTGTLQLDMSRTGNLTMFGKYTIEEGDYLFTNFKIIHKSFELKRGGSIQWFGDPYSAVLNVQAVYSGLTAPVYPLIQEFLVGLENSNVAAEARERTEVELTMTLQGSLVKPDISFDIAFPNLSGAIRGYTESKINILESNPSAMLEQVMGLLITRSFLPALGSGETISKGINNTLSEIISASLSSYLSGLLGDIIPQGQFLSGVDFQANLDLPLLQTTDPGDLDNLTSTSLRFNLPLEFFNDRVSLNVGGNYVTGSFTDAGQYFAGDITFEYKLTPDGQLRFRAYNRTSETFIEGRKNKVGAGIALRREYDQFSDINPFRRKKKPEPVQEPLEGG